MPASTSAWTTARARASESALFDGGSPTLSVWPSTATDIAGLPFRTFTTSATVGFDAGLMVGVAVSKLMYSAMCPSLARAARMPLAVSSWTCSAGAPASLVGAAVPSLAASRTEKATRASFPGVRMAGATISPPPAG